MRYLLALIVLALATPASAELIFFAEDRSMSVAGHRFEGDRVIVSLRGGGEMTFDRSLVFKIAEDEVPFPVETPADAIAQVEAPRGPSLAETTPYDPIIEPASGGNRID